MEQNYVNFYSPGTFVSEQTSKKIREWDIEEALKMVPGIKERHGATPYGFSFSTRSRTDEELDSKETKTSKMYYLGGTVRTLEEVNDQNDPNEQTLRSNMRCNGYDRVIENNNSWKITLPLEEGDTVLEWDIPTA